jgi:hypothetical protein
MQKNSNEPLTTPDQLTIGRRDLLRGVAIAGVAAVGIAAPLDQATADIWEEGDDQCRPASQEKDPAYQLDDVLLAGFMNVSEALTGVTPLDRQLGGQYLKRYARQAELTDRLRPLIDAYSGISRSGAPASDADVDQKIMKTELRPAAEQLIFLWYNSAFFLPLVPDATNPRKWIYGTVEQYERSLLWSVARAHAPMISGGRPGYWARAPRA